MATLSRRSSRLQFCTLGMFIIDEIEYIDGRSPSSSIIGGAGTYAAIGARLVAGEAYSNLVSWIVDIGSDFPPDFRTLIEAWQTDCVFRVDNQRLTTRAWNGYGANDFRSFHYLTPKLRLEASCLADEQRSSSSFHMVCSSQRCISLVKEIIKLRASEERPIIVWEPVPDLCTPAEVAAFQEAIRHVDVVSPNAEELASLFRSSKTHTHSQDDIANQILNWSIGTQGGGALIVREGAQGCTVYTKASRSHFPAYFRGPDSNQVVDPTGGGNTFLGALAMALTAKTEPPFHEVQRVWSGVTCLDTEADTDERLFTAVSFATTAASFAIQQSGVPLLDKSSGEWNGEAFARRLWKYVERERPLIGKGLGVI